MKVAAVQMDVKILDSAHNLSRILEKLDAAARNGAKVVVFPECALSGYCFNSREESYPVAETVPGPSTERLAEAARRLDCTVVMGMLERREEDLFNAAVVVGPEGIVGSYHKVHLPFLGIDRYATLGDEPFPVFDTLLGPIGVNICFDLNFPESGRSVKLKGARLLAVPTNWPVGTNTYKHVANARGQENHIFVAVANRVGLVFFTTFSPNADTASPDIRRSWTAWARRWPKPERTRKRSFTATSTWPKPTGTESNTAPASGISTASRTGGRNSTQRLPNR